MYKSHMYTLNRETVWNGSYIPKELLLKTTGEDSEEYKLNKTSHKPITTES